MSSFLPGVTLILGKSFTGKTARLLYELRKQPRVVLADPKCAQLAALPKWSHLWPEWVGGPFELPGSGKVGGRWASPAVPDFFSSRLDGKFRAVLHVRHSFKAQLDALCFLLMAVKNLVLAVDELALFAPAGNAFVLGKAFTMIVVSGRHEGMRLAATIQRPSAVHNVILSQATRMLAYRITERDDLDTLADYLPREFVEALPFLPDHACIDWQDGREPYTDFSLRGKLGGLLPAPPASLTL